MSLWVMGTATDTTHFYRVSRFRAMFGLPNTSGLCAFVGGAMYTKLVITRQMQGIVWGMPKEVRAVCVHE